MFNPKEMMSFTLFEILKETVKELESRLLQMEEDNALLMEENEVSSRLIVKFAGLEGRKVLFRGKCFGKSGYEGEIFSILVKNHCHSKLTSWDAMSFSTCDTDTNSVDECGFSNLLGSVIPSEYEFCISGSEGS